MRRRLLGTATLTSFVVGVMSACSNSDATATYGRVYSKPPAYVLAALDAGQNVPDDDPRITRYTTVLNEIRSKCRNTPQEISDITIDVLMTLQRKGVQIDVYDLLTRVNDAMPNRIGATYDYKQIAAAFKALGSS